MVVGAVLLSVSLNLGFGGMVVVVQHLRGNPEHPALDVRLENGRLESLCFHELDKVDEEAIRAGARKGE